MNWLLTPLHYTFMQIGFTAAVLVGMTCAVLGCFVVLRRMAFIGDAIAHTVLPGVVVAYLRHFNLFFGAMISGLFTAFGIGWLSRREAVREDTAIGVLFTGMFAIGLLLISHTHSFQDFTGLFFGNITSVTRADLLLIAITALIVFMTLALFYKELELSSVDPSYSAVIGLRADRMRDVLLILLALAVVTGVQAVGVILISGLLVTPAAAASLLTSSLRKMMLLAAVFAVASGILGLYTAWYCDVSSGAAIVLVATLIFGVAFIARSMFGTNRGTAAAADAE